MTTHCITLFKVHDKSIVLQAELNRLQLFYYLVGQSQFLGIDLFYTAMGICRYTNTNQVSILSFEAYIVGGVVCLCLFCYQ